MLSLSKLFQRVRKGFRAAAPTRSSRSRLNNYNVIKTSTTTSKKFTVESVLPPSIVQQMIEDMEKLYVQKNPVNELQYQSHVLSRILAARDAEIAMARKALAELHNAILLADKDNTNEKLREVQEFIKRFCDKDQTSETIIGGLPLGPGLFAKEFFQGVARAAKVYIMKKGRDNPTFQARIFKIANSLSRFFCGLTYWNYMEITNFESAAAMVAVATLSAITLAIMQIHPENFISDVCDYLYTTMSLLNGAAYKLYTQDWWWVFLESLYD